MKRNYWIALATLVIVAAAAVLLWPRREAPPAPPQAQAPAPVVAAKPVPSPAAAPVPVAPSFDAVNVGADGSAVVAGRAAPGAEVTVLAGGSPVGHATADANGEFVIMTDRALPPGPQSLTLSSQTKGAPAISSASSLALVVPEHGAPQAPVAALLPPSGPAKPLGGSARVPRHIALDMVEYDADGRTVLSGRADPGTKVAIAINGHAEADATAEATAAWSVSLASGVPAGRYRLTMSGRLADGGDAGEVALELRRPAPGETGNYLAVVPGNTLWHLAARSYGNGLRYVEIYHANTAEVENPNLIYPGQLLALPKSAGK